MTACRASVLLRKRRSLYSSRELEEIVVQQAKRDVKLRHGGEWKCERTVDLGDAFHCDLTPGGRWLLDTTKRFHAGVRYADLDAADPCWQQLIPSFPAPLVYFRSHLEPIADAPVLTIHLAIAIGRERLSSGESSGGPGVDVHEICVWRISPAYDDTGVITGLQANRISTFSHSLSPGCRHVRSIILHGPNLVLHQREPSSTFSVIRWAEADGFENDFPRKVITYPRCYVRLCL